MNRICILLSLLAVTFLCGCRGSSSPKGGTEGDTLRLRYAAYLTMIEHDGYTVATIADPWKSGRTLHRYVLVPKGGETLPAALPEGTVVRTPVERSVVFTTAHCQLLYYLGAQRAIAGVTDLKYILVPDLQRRVKAGNVADCGDGMQPMVEKMIDLRPEALILSPFENSGGYGKMEKMGVPIIEAADYMETSPLGRAEWMKFYGRLYGRAETADSLFAVVEHSYLRLKSVASQLPTGRSMLTERKTGSVWYAPGGRSTVGRMIADARGLYAFAADTHSGSVPLSFEQVLDAAASSEVWAFKYNGTRPMTRGDLLAEFAGYSSLQAFKAGEVYACNASRKPFFEETPFRPDYLLRDFILLLHPDGGQLGKLRYYEKVGE